MEWLIWRLLFALVWLVSCAFIPSYYMPFWMGMGGLLVLLTFLFRVLKWLADTGLD